MDRIIADLSDFTCFLMIALISIGVAMNVDTFCRSVRTGRYSHPVILPFRLIGGTYAIYVLLARYLTPATIWTVPVLCADLVSAAIIVIAVREYLGEPLMGWGWDSRLWGGTRQQTTHDPETK